VFESALMVAESGARVNVDARAAVAKGEGKSSQPLMKTRGEEESVVSLTRMKTKNVRV
jgi:hypothetical protein